MANAALGFVHDAHTELAGSASGSGVRRRRPERVHDRHPGGGLHPVVCRHHRGARRGRHHCDLRSIDRRGVRGRHRSGHVALPVRGVGRRRVQPPDHSGRRGCCACTHRPGEPTRLPESRSARRRGCPRDRGSRDRSSARRGDPRVGSTGDVVGRRACSDAEDLPRLRHPVLDGGNRAARRTIRRGGRDREGPQGGVAATHRHTGASNPRSQFRHRRRHTTPGSSRRDSRRGGPVLGRTAQPLRAGRPEARPAARRHRRVDRRPRNGRRGRTGRAPRTDSDRSWCPADTGPEERGDHDDRLGDGIPSGPVLGRPPRVRRCRQSPSRRRRGGCSRRVLPRHRRSSADGGRASCTGPSTTPASWPTTSSGISPGAPLVDQRFVPMYPNSWTSPRKARPSRT